MCNKFRTALFVSCFLWAASAAGVPKPHVISFGKWTSAKWYVGPEQNKPLDLKIRGLYVNTRLKEYTTGAPHDVTDKAIRGAPGVSPE